jgi:hypothetical protein
MDPIPPKTPDDPRTTGLCGPAAYAAGPKNRAKLRNHHRDDDWCSAQSPNCLIFSQIRVTGSIFEQRWNCTKG